MLYTAVSALAQQQRLIITGKIIAQTYYVSDILIVNIDAGRETRTDSLGNFHLPAKNGDIIHITGPSIVSLQLTVGKDINSGEIITVQPTEAYELEAVEVNKLGITSESLGLVKENQKRYTPAERKLYTAGDFKPIHLLGIIAGGMPLDPVFNAINGRTRMLKKAVAVERKETALETMTGIFTSTDIQNNFAIPEEYVKGFLYYCVEDKECLAALLSGNDEMLELYMAPLAIKYLDLLKNEE